MTYRMLLLITTLFLAPPSLGSAGSFTDNKNGTVTDNDMGWIWQQEDAGFMNWETAVSHCIDLNMAGSEEWRLPNVKELRTLITDDRHKPALDPRFFPKVHSAMYWTSTTYINANYSWCVDFTNGATKYCDMHEKSYVRCVRGGTE